MDEFLLFGLGFLSAIIVVYVAIPYLKKETDLKNPFKKRGAGRPKGAKNKPKTEGIVA